MQITLDRFSDNGDSTLGLLFIDNKFFSFSLEDEYRKVKVPGETCIPEGLYELKIQKTDTPLTIKHRAAYGPWFKYHIEITGIPNFQGVYIHSGSDDSHTEGCLLLGDILYNHYTYPANELTDSLKAIKRFYELVYPILDAGKEKIFLRVQYPKLA